MSMKLIAACVVLAAVLTPSAQAQGRPDLVAQSLRDPARQHVPSEVLVQFRASIDEAAKARAVGRHDARLHEELLPAQRRGDGKGDLDVVKLPAGLSVAEGVRRLARESEIEFVEPNWVYTHQATSNDAYYTSGSLWGMQPSGYGSRAAAAWANNNICASDVFIGVIDEGVMHGHPDLADNIWTNPYDPIDGIDNDGNGYVDDVRGWDFAGNDNGTYDGSTDDHGTHVAGTIGAKGGNGAGVAGMCWQARLITAKFLGRNGGTTSNAIRAVDYITGLKTLHRMRIVATNNSWGGGGYSQALRDAIARAGRADILFVAAAGNSSVNNDSSPHYPSSYGDWNIISVASITSSGALSSFSNYGATSVDLGAPGSGIWSTVPTRKSADYASYSGTSMATPHVTGGVALYASRNPSASASTIKNAILNSATPTASLAGKTVTGGRLNVGGF